MTPKARSTLILTASAAAAFALILYVVTRFETQILAVNWRLVSFACIAVALAYTFYRLQVGKSDFDLLDTVMSGGKADRDAILIYACFALYVWAVVQQAVAKEHITELVLGGMGIFVVRKALGGFSDAMRSRPAATPAGDVNILPGANVQPQAQPGGAPSDPDAGFQAYPGNPAPPAIR